MPIGRDLPDLPKGWVWCHIEDVGEAILGRQRKPHQAQETLHPYLRVANVQDDSLDLSDMTSMHFTDEERERYRLEPHDILLCEGQSPELVGRPAMFRGEIPDVYFQNHLIRFRCRSYVDPEYALLVFRTYMHDGTFRAVATSTTNLANLGLARFKRLPFPLPPVRIQTALGDLARATKNELDYLRERLSSTKEYLESAVATLRDHVITSGPVDLEALASNGAKGTRWVTAADVVQKNAPIVYGIVQPGPPQDPGSGVPYIRGQDIRDGEIVLDDLPWTTEQIATKYSRSTVTGGDVLLSIIRYMRAAIVPDDLDGANISRGAARFRPNQDVEPSYLMHWLESWSAQRWLKERLRGTGMPGLNLADIRRLPVPLPPIEQQRKMGEQLDSQIATARAIARHLEQCERLTDAAERRLLVSLVAGKLSRDVTEQFNASSAAGIRGDEILQRLNNKESVTPSRRDATEVSVASSGSRKSKNRSAGPSRRPILEVLREASAPLTPEETFRRTEIDIEMVDEFFAELRSAVTANLIAVDRPDATQVFIRAVADK